MLIKVNKSFIKQFIICFAGTGSKAGTMLIHFNKSFIKQLIMHFIIFLLFKTSELIQKIFLTINIKRKRMASPWPKWMVENFSCWSFLLMYTHNC